MNHIDSKTILKLDVFDEAEEYINEEFAEMVKKFEEQFDDKEDPTIPLENSFLEMSSNRKHPAIN